MKQACKKRIAQRGVTLIELMISVTLGLLLSAVAAYVYQSVQLSSRNLEAQAIRNENANIIFDLIGRDLKQSGFFPVHFPLGTNKEIRGKFVDVLEGSPFANTISFQQAVFGCSNATLNVATGLCNPVVANAPDTVIVNYFTDDTFANSWEGTRRDCLGDDVELASFNGIQYNKARASPVIAVPNSTMTVAAPLLVQNIYSLSNVQTVTYYTNKDVITRSIRCDGNNVGSDGSQSPAMALVQGIEQMRVMYGLFDPAKKSFSVEQLYSATDVSNLPVVSVTNEKNKEVTSIRGWQRVATIQVCILTKTLDPNARQTSISGTFTDCDGTTVTPGAADKAIYKRQTRRFAVRNNIPATYQY
jgi:type IV pilus assembly protein PilW